MRLTLGLRMRITVALAVTAAATALFAVLGAMWIIAGIIDRADQRELRSHYDAARGVLNVSLLNPGPAPLIATVTDLAYGNPPRVLHVPAGQSVSSAWDLAACHHWYDLQWQLQEQPHWLRRLAGHLETGRPSMSDPAATAPMTTAL